MYRRLRSSEFRARYDGAQYDVLCVKDYAWLSAMRRSQGLVRVRSTEAEFEATLVSIVGPTEARPADGLAVDFVVESDRAQLSQIVQRVRDGRLRTNIGTVSTLDDAVAAFNPTERRAGKTIIRVRP